MVNPDAYGRVRPSHEAKEPRRCGGLHPPARSHDRYRIQLPPRLRVSPAPPQAAVAGANSFLSQRCAPVVRPLPVGLKTHIPMEIACSTNTAAITRRAAPVPGAWMLAWNQGLGAMVWAGRVRPPFKCAAMTSPRSRTSSPWDGKQQTTSTTTPAMT